MLCLTGTLEQNLLDSVHPKQIFIRAWAKPLTFCLKYFIKILLVITWTPEHRHFGEQIRINQPCAGSVIWERGKIG